MPDSIRWETKHFSFSGCAEVREMCSCWPKGGRNKVPYHFLGWLVSMMPLRTESPLVWEPVKKWYLSLPTTRKQIQETTTVFEKKIQVSDECCSLVDSLISACGTWAENPAMPHWTFDAQNWEIISGIVLGHLIWANLVQKQKENNAYI